LKKLITGHQKALNPVASSCDIFRPKNRKTVDESEIEKRKSVSLRLYEERRKQYLNCTYVCLQISSLF
jgi:hypothetical protein